MSDAAPAAAPAPVAAPNATPNAQSPAGGNVAPATPPAAPERPPNPLEWDDEVGDWVAKTKVDGKEAKRRFADLHKDAQQAASAQKRYEEAKAIKQQAAEYERRNRELAEAAIDPQRLMALWEANGLDPNAMLEHARQLREQEARLTPEQREHRAMKAKLAAYEQQQQEARQREAQQAEEAAEAAEEERWTKAFTKSMERVGIPANPKVRDHTTMLMWAAKERVEQAVAAGEMEPVPMSEIAKHVKSELYEMARDIIAGMSPEERAQHLGPDIITGIATQSVKGAAPIPRTVVNQPRARDGKFSRFSEFSGLSSFSRLADRGEGLE